MPRLPLEITEATLSLLAQDDPSLSSMKACALVCHDFHHLCRKHIFATISLNYYYDQSSPSFTSVIGTSTPRLQELLDTSPEIAHYIRNLIYNVSNADLLDASIVQTFRKITRLKFLRIRQPYTRGPAWDDSPLRPALLHLLHLPTLNEFHLFNIQDFVISDLAPCINLRHFELDLAMVVDANKTVTSNLPETSIQLRNISVNYGGVEALTKMYAVCRQDGKSLIDYSCLNKLSFKIHRLEHVQASLDFLSHCKQLTSVEVEVHGSFIMLTQISLSQMLRPSMKTLKHLHVKTVFGHLQKDGDTDFFCGLCIELLKMENNNVIETITIQVGLDTYLDSRQGDEWASFDTVLTQPGWSKLQRVVLRIIFWNDGLGDELEHALRKLRQTQFPKLTLSKSLSFEFFIRGELVQGL